MSSKLLYPNEASYDVTDDNYTFYSCLNCKIFIERCLSLETLGYTVEL